MTVKDLIERLKDQPDDLRVLVRGYEGGFNDIGFIEQIPIKLNANSAWYYGKHEEVEMDEKDEIAIVFSK